MEKFQVEIRNNPVLKKLFLEHAKNIGLKFNKDFDTDNVHSFQVGVYNSKNITYASNGFYKPDEYPILSMAEFLEIGKTKTVKLNEDYTATITKDNIKVCCQYFSPNVLKEVLAVWESLK